jgi:hypothetical protein
MFLQSSDIIISGVVIFGVPVGPVTIAVEEEHNVSL